MARIAYLGPECSFSHDLLCRDFHGNEHVAFKSFHDVVAAVANGDCPKGVIPFHNTTRLSIEEAQRELVANLGNVNVTDVIAFDVKHYCCSFCELGEIREIWSKSVVQHQVRAWYDEHVPRAQWIDKSSTSAAVQELAESKASGVAAIGTRSAAKRYNVPVIARGIQNKPNTTLFFVVETGPFDAEGKDHLLLCLPRPQGDEMQKISDLALKSRCSISTNWALNPGKKNSAYFVELHNHLSTLDLHAAVDTVRRSIRRVSLCGGYAGKSITKMIWSSMKWPQVNKP